jgi:hypothetical protein
VDRSVLIDVHGVLQSRNRQEVAEASSWIKVSFGNWSSRKMTDMPARPHGDNSNFGFRDQRRACHHRGKSAIAK